MTSCPHCLRLREYLADVNAKLGRPVDSFDHDRHGIPREIMPTKAEVEGCPCRCHAHLGI